MSGHETRVHGPAPDGVVPRKLWAAGATPRVQAHAALYGGTCEELLRFCEDLPAILPLALVCGRDHRDVVAVGIAWARRAIELHARRYDTVGATLALRAVASVANAMPEHCTRVAEQLVGMLRSPLDPGVEAALRAAMHCAVLAAQTARPIRGVWDAEQVGDFTSRALDAYRGRTLQLELGDPALDPSAVEMELLLEAQRRLVPVELAAE